MEEAIKLEGALDGPAERVRGSLFLQELYQSSGTDAIKIGRNLWVAPNGGNLVMPSGPIWLTGA
jgi:hypothetical protein